ARRFAQIERAEHDKHGNRDRFLNDLQLWRGELHRPPATGRDLQAILAEGDEPAAEHDRGRAIAPEPQSTRPGHGHERGRQDEQEHGSHGRSSCKILVRALSVSDGWRHSSLTLRALMAQEVCKTITWPA